MINFYGKKIKRNINDFGYTITFIKLLSRLFAPIYHERELILYEIDMSEIKRELNRMYTYKIINPKEKCYFDQIIKLEEWVGSRIMKLELEHIVCGAALHGDKLIGFNFVVIREAVLPLLKLKLKTSKEQAWSEQISVHKEYRRQGVANGLRETTYKELRKRKIKMLFGHRAKYNIASKKSVDKYLKNDLLIMNYKNLLSMQWIEYTLIRNQVKDRKRSMKPNVDNKRRSIYPFEIELKKLVK